MKQNFLALSMGLINPEIPNQNFPSQVSIYSNILRDITQVCIDSGVKVYLPFSVESINSLDQVYNLICHSGYCVVSLDNEKQGDLLIEKAMASVRRYGEVLAKSMKDPSQWNYVEDFVECFRPYSITVGLDNVKSTSDLFDHILKCMTEVVDRGRGLALDTKASVSELLRPMHISRATG